MVPPVDDARSYVVYLEVWVRLAEVKERLFYPSFDATVLGGQHTGGLRRAFAGDVDERERRFGVERRERLRGSGGVAFCYLDVFAASPPLAPALRRDLGWMANSLSTAFCETPKAQMHP